MALQLVSKQSEVRLAESMNEISDFEGWQALHFHLDQLLDEYKSDYQVKIAINLINDLLKTNEGYIFILTDRGIVVLCNNADKSLVQKLVFQLRYLYMDDPLAYDDEGHDNPAFCTTYDLETERGAFVDFVSRRMAQTVRKASPSRPQRPAVLPVARAAVAPASQGMVDLSSARTVNLEDDLMRADLSHAFRRQPVCALLPGGARKVFDELYVHIAHLRNELKAEIDFFSNRWLFKYLTQILDQRMLAMAKADPQTFFASPVSLNLNAETLLSPAFSEFDAAIPAAMKVAIVIEVPVVDVFADIIGFNVARSEVQKQGYRVCIDGLTTTSLPNIDREKIGADLLKVQWNADAQNALASKENRDLAAAIQRCGPKRIILCRCDTPQAISYGQALGISLFQGRYIDNILNPSDAMEN